TASAAVPEDVLSSLTNCPDLARERSHSAARLSPASDVLHPHGLGVGGCDASVRHNARAPEGYGSHRRLGQRRRVRAVLGYNSQGGLAGCTRTTAIEYRGTPPTDHLKAHRVRMWRRRFCGDGLSRVSFHLSGG